MEKIKVGITVGDINGIGLEVILKTISNPSITNICTPIIYGSSKVVAYHKNIVEVSDFQFHSIQPNDKPAYNKVNVVNCWNDNINITLGKMTDVGGKCAKLAFEQAVKDLKNGVIDCLVTAPINKKAMQLAGYKYPGHTEYLTEQFSTKDSLMLLVSDMLRIGVVTGHLPLKDVATNITKESIIQKIKILNESLKIDFGIERPVIAVLGLNPHAGDEGAIGKEEQSIIAPAVEAAKQQVILAYGPLPADGFFGAGNFKKFDAVLAMYHDQGLIPFKTLAFESGVNYTAGLSAVRTSPDHGTAYDIAGKNMADGRSFARALYLAMDVSKNRQQYVEMRANALVKQSRPLDDEGDDEVVVDEA